jgi:hypothetical protein
MNLSDLTHGEPWMDPEERQCAAELVQSIQQSFTDRQIAPTPFLILRVQDYLLHHTLCRRLERSLTPDPAAIPPFTVPPSLAEHIGKCRDRLRKALKELEDAAAKLAPPSPPPPPPARPFNLPDFYKPILEEVGVDLINDPVFFDAIERGDDAFLETYPYPPMRNRTPDNAAAPTPSPTINGQSPPAPISYPAFPVSGELAPAPPPHRPLPPRLQVLVRDRAV